MIYLTLIVALFLGYWAREILETLRRIDTRISLLHKGEKNKPQQSASFAEPMSKAEVIALIDQERVEAMNER